MCHLTRRCHDREFLREVVGKPGRRRRIEVGPVEEDMAPAGELAPLEAP